MNSEKRVERHLAGVPGGKDLKTPVNRRSSFFLMPCRDGCRAVAYYLRARSGCRSCTCPALADIRPHGLLFLFGDLVYARRLGVLLLRIEVFLVPRHVALLENGFLSCAVALIGYARFGGAVVAAEHLFTAFQAISYDAKTTIRSRRCELMDRAFEAVKGECSALSNHLKVLVVAIAA